MHIAFLTLFLGLTSGVHPFELSVAGPAAAVEIILDGQVAERLGGPPWKGEIDFGPDLVPRDLVARALDASGQEIARTRQWINLPRPPAEVEIALEGGRPGAPETVRVLWERLTHDPPVSTSATLDGQPLQLDARNRAALPAYDPGSTHVVTAEVRFPSNVIARKDVIFGGQAGETFTELTAVPVRLRGRDAKPADLEGTLLLEDGTPARIAAVERGPAELYLVRVPSARTVKAQYNSGFGRPRGELAFGTDDRIRLVSPWAKAFRGEGERTDLFDLSPYFLGRHGLIQHLVGGFFQQDGTERLRFADAAAVAGLHASAGGRRRAVVLMLDAASEDASWYDPATVRRYLSSVRVPFYVWSLDRRSLVEEKRADWGKIEQADDMGALSQAFLKVVGDLDRQRIVWVHGRHLPQSIGVAPGAKGIEIVAAADISTLPSRRPGEEAPSVAFLTRYPELVTGPQSLDVKTTGPVAAVEVLLDGRSLGRLDGPPWNGTLHLGPELLPHGLVVRALDRQGREIARERQEINVPELLPKKASGMTPVPVRVANVVGKAELPPVEELQGKLLAHGQPLRVVSAGRGLGDILIVRVPERSDTLLRMTRQLGPIREDNNFLLSLGVDTFIRLVSPRPRIHPVTGLRSGVFNAKPAFLPEGGGIVFYMGTTEFGPEESRRPEGVPLEVRYTDAVAVAGLEAAATGHRRAVVLVLAGETPEQSRYTPAEVRRYLDGLGVPLHVWNLDDRSSAGRWEEAADVREIQVGLPGLKDDMDRQLIVWVEGRHLLRDIQLAPDAEGLELVAR